MRRGISITEVLVSLSVIGLLMAILVPAVQQSREAARLMQCKSNLHQLGVACSNFEQTYRFLPSSSQAFTDLLPYLEGGNGVVSPPVMSCPSDSKTHRDLGEVNYHISSGSSFRDAAWDFDGILDTKLQTKPGKHGRALHEISDGLSNTAYFSERLCAGSFVSDLTEAELANDPTRYLWYIREPLFGPSGNENELVRRCEMERTTQFPASPGTLSLFGVWMPGYNHLTTPNRPPCFNGNLDSATDNVPVVPPTSLHSGGISLLLCDGSVRFVQNGVDKSLWRAVGTRNDGHAIPGDW